MRTYIDIDGSLALVSGWSGIDLAKYAPDTPLGYIKNDATQSLVEALTVLSPDRAWTGRGPGRPLDLSFTRSGDRGRSSAGSGRVAKLGRGSRR